MRASSSKPVIDSMDEKDQAFAKEEGSTGGELVRTKCQRVFP